MPVLADGQWLYVDLDVDQYAGTGNPTHAGAEFVLSVGFGDRVGAVRWQSGNWQSTVLPSFSASFANGVATFAFDEADIGDPDGFNFYVVSQNVSGQTSDADWAPDSGVWNYKLPESPLKLSVVCSTRRQRSRRASNSPLRWRRSAPTQGSSWAAAAASAVAQ